jgi:hypothetical protein
VEQVNNANQEPSVQLVLDEQVTPTLDCSTYYESGYYPPTSTPTRTRTTNNSGGTDVLVTRDIEYESENFRCLDILSSDIFLSITNDESSFIKSIVNVLQNSERFADADDFGGNYIRELEIVSIEDLDDDGSDEIIVYIHTRGASCCTGLAIFYWDESKSNYSASNIIWRKYSLTPILEHSNENGDNVFVTRALFSTALIRYCNACSGVSPIEIYQFINDELIDVTKKFPKRVELDALDWLDRFSLGSTNDDGYQIEYLGVYLSDMYISGNDIIGNQVFDEECNLLFDEQECEEYKGIVLERLSDPTFGEN